MNIASKPAAHAAPGQYLGFALQPVRLCHHLLTAPPGALVSLEHLDDVAVHYPNGSVLLEQCKSALKQNPVSDRAADLWKTFSHWFEGCGRGGIDVLKARFSLYVVPTRAGKLVQALHEARTEEEAASIDAKVGRLLENSATSAACASHLRSYLAADKNLRACVIARFRLENRDQSPVSPLLKLIEVTVPPELALPIARSAIGIAKELADELIRQGKPAIIEGDVYKRQFRSFVRRHNLPDLLVSLAPKPVPDDIEAVLAVRPTFVRQLEIIDVGLDETSRAVSDYLRTSADKTMWAEQGLLYPGSLDLWDEDLIRRHSAIRGEIEDTHTDRTGVVRGRLAYRQSSRIEAALEGRAVPGHFVHGCLNALADDFRIGWHPDYAALLHSDGS
ncbi:MULTISPECIES: ABC-three component system protein [unclassified Methylobacterium]|jgi:hypothetical protein|uniref:ABC-three component system protein n=1 Tax=unclassified Methylobacterium TaxID=2615210 RepID=UPI0013539787|nr:ABC-three component system protein [Methylobacterium sp. 2A]MWV24403.1 hypothetical protein [Methylobacterium sp. 2A]